MDGHGHTKGGKDEVGPVLDGLEQWGNSIGERKVKCPIGGGRERDSLGTDTHGVDLGGVGPRDGTPGDGKGADKEVRAGNDSM